MATSVLIVDDHPSFRQSARMLLESEGWDVVGEAADAVSAFARTRELHPDVVLLDVQLPDIDGFHVSRGLTSELNGHAPAVVMTSSRDGSDYGTLAIDNGARGFVPKSQLSGAALEELIA